MNQDTRLSERLRPPVRPTGPLLLLLLSACGGGTTSNAPASPEPAPESSEGAADAPTAMADEPAQAAEPSAPPAPPAPAHWGYEGEHGPDRWGHLDRKFGLCDSGKEQSPIDIAKPKKGGDHKALAISYKKASDTTIVNNGHTVQVNYETGSFMTFDGKQYELAQLHLHAPSEHKIDGVAAAAELHLVHKSSEGELAVIGILLREGKENRFLKEFWAELPDAEVERPLSAPINVADALPKDHHYYTYPGSLTTPPCTEGVRWIVMKKPMTIGKEQMARLGGLFGQNARPPQPVNERVVERN
jgi:carbonic anhydrase